MILGGIKVLRCKLLIEGCCKNLWSNKEKRVVKGVNIVSLNYSDSYTDMMLDFSTNYNKNRITDVMNNHFHNNSNANKRRVEGYNGKNILALDMIQRVLKLGIYADYLLVDSWYAKPDFINTVQTNGLMLLQELQIILESGSLLESIILLSPYTLK